MDTEFIRQLAADVAEEVGAAVRPDLTPVRRYQVEAIVRELVVAAFDCYATEAARRTRDLAAPRRKRPVLAAR